MIWEEREDGEESDGRRGRMGRRVMGGEGIWERMGGKTDRPENG